MSLKPDTADSLTHEERVQRPQQLTADLAKAIDLAEEQRRILRDLARDAAELAESLASIDERPDPPPRTRKR
jgi:hypothetical protein